GYYILGADFDTPNEIRAVVDAGPLGYTAIAAHGHADALSFTLSVGGSEFLIDPGTCAYHTQERWRQYFRGTAAHNTLRVDGRAPRGRALLPLRRELPRRCGGRGLSHRARRHRAAPGAARQWRERALPGKPVAARRLGVARLRPAPAHQHDRLAREARRAGAAAHDDTDR